MVEVEISFTLQLLSGLLNFVKDISIGHINLSTEVLVFCLALNTKLISALFNVRRDTFHDCPKSLWFLAVSPGIGPESDGITNIKHICGPGFINWL